MREALSLKDFKSLSEDDKAIMSKYIRPSIHVPYGHDRYINIDNELFSSEQLDNKVKGLYVWLCTYKQLDRNTDKIIAPRMSLDFIVDSTGLDNPSGYAIKILRQMLISLESHGLIKADKDLASINKTVWFDVEILHARDKFEYFTQVYIGNVDAIMRSSDGLDAFKHIYTYAVVRSFVTSNKKYTKVVTIKKRLISERMNVSKNTYYNRLHWLRDHHVIGMFNVQMLNDYGGQKVLMTDIRDMKDLVTTIDDWKRRKIISKVLS